MVSDFFQPLIKELLHFTAFWLFSNNNPDYIQVIEADERSVC